jgi:hypothetical protein
MLRHEESFVVRNPLKINIKPFKESQCVSMFTACIGYVPCGSVSQPPGRASVPGSGINYTRPSSCRKKNLLGRGVTKVGTTVL